MSQEVQNKKNIRIQSRIDTETGWLNNNPVLALREIGYEYDSNNSKGKCKFKIGDGTTKWSDLPYASLSGSGVSDEDLKNFITNDLDNNLALGVYSVASGKMTIAYGEASEAGGFGMQASKEPITVDIPILGTQSFDFSSMNVKVVSVDTTNKTITIQASAFSGLNQLVTTLRDSGEPGFLLKVNDIFVPIISYDDPKTHQIIYVRCVLHAFGDFPSEASNFTNKAVQDICIGVAYGDYSHTEGKSNISLGEATHTEGSYNTASGICSHAEGNANQAKGEFSHAEGTKTKANGYAAHAEGHATSVTGNNAHAEGYNTEARSDQSHAEGHYTIAASAVQHVQGKFNAIDTGNNYAHIVGNGSSESDRKNIHTVSWNGDGWYAGNINSAQGIYGTNISASNSIGGTIATSLMTKTNSIEPSTLGDFVKIHGALSTGTVHANQVGTYAFAQGNNVKATGGNSHAEGYNTEATASQSHAEGHYTKATEDIQHVQGKFNYLDADGKAGNYAHIVGNGSSETNRSNAHTLDWNGNAWFAGNVTVGVNKKTLATNSDLTAAETRLQIAIDKKANNIIDGTAATSLQQVGNTASASNTFAHGAGTKATAYGAHAEGNSTEANGGNSHAEGYKTIASASQSHAEGSNTIAAAVSAHAEGYGTVANGSYQHTSGSWNLLDTSNYNNTNKGRYITIVGNGSKEDEKDADGNIIKQYRSNAYTLDWNGNAWFAGDIKIGGTGWDDPNAKNLITLLTKWEKSFAESTWEEVIYVCQNRINTNWAIGDTKTMTVNDKEYTIVIIDTNVTQYADDSGYAPYTFQFKECIDDFALTNVDFGKNDGWPVSDIYNSTLTEVLNTFPNEIRNAIKEVKIKALGYKVKEYNGTNYKLSSVHTGKFKLFLPAHSHLETKVFTVYITDGTKYDTTEVFEGNYVYQYYASNPDALLKTLSDGTTAVRWLLTTGTSYSSKSLNQYSVTAKGSITSSSATIATNTNPIYISPVFCF